jgi:hypothetical protein
MRVIIILVILASFMLLITHLRVGALRSLISLKPMGLSPEVCAIYSQHKHRIDSHNPSLLTRSEPPQPTAARKKLAARRYPKRRRTNEDDACTRFRRRCSSDFRHHPCQGGWRRMQRGLRQFEEKGQEKALKDGTKWAK